MRAHLREKGVVRAIQFEKLILRGDECISLVAARYGKNTGAHTSAVAVGGYF